MGARGGRAAARKGSTHSGGHKSHHLLVSSSSDGIEGSCSSNSQSCGSINDPPGAAYLIQSGNQSHVQYINSDGSIFTLASNSNNFADATNKLGHQQLRQQQQQHDQETSYLSQAQSTDSANSLSTANHLVATSRKQQPIDSVNSNQKIQHRRLQHQVHQQLQRIYGNSGRQGHRLAGQAVRALERNQQLLKQTRNKRPQQHSINESNLMHNDHSIEFDNQRQQQQQSRHQPMMANSKQQQQQDQTYDSLSPASMVSKGFGHQQADGFGYSQHDNHGQTHICSIPEEGNGDEDELLLPGDSGASCESKRVAIHRKNHLEDLHYATVTAAALLTATANAAAALAATTTKSSSKQRSNIASQAEARTVDQSLNTIYSEAYQEVKRRRACHDETAAVVARHKQQQQQKQEQTHLHRAPIYTDAVDLNNVGRFASSASALYGSPPSITANKVPQSQSRIYNVVQPVLQGGQQLLQQQQQHIKQVNYGRPPQPPMRRLPPNSDIHHQFNPMSSQAELIRQHQLQRQLQHHQQQQQLQRGANMRQVQPRARPKASAGAVLPPPVPALAILHHRIPTSGGKGGVSSQAAEANLINQLLVNNFVSAQRAAAAVAAATAASSVDPAQYMQYSYAGNAPGAANNHKMAKIGNIQAVVGRNTIDPMSYAVNLGSKEKLYVSGQGGQIFSLPNMAPSDSSGHSNVPLALDRFIRPLSFIERICQIDLTIFWWSLLIVCFLFIGAIITISRYFL